MPSSVDFWRADSSNCCCIVARAACTAGGQGTAWHSQAPNPSGDAKPGSAPALVHASVHTRQQADDRHNACATVVSPTCLKEIARHKGVLAIWDMDMAAGRSALMGAAQAQGKGGTGACRPPSPLGAALYGGPVLHLLF